MTPADTSRPPPLLVLVADDEPHIRALLAKCLKKMDTEVIEAADGEEAWELFGQRAPDLVVTDIRMPLLDGIGLLQRIRSVSARAEVLMVTGFVETQTVLEALRGGATNFLEKPFRLDELTRQLSISLHRCRVAKEAERLGAELARERRHRELTGRLATMGRLLAGLAHEIHNPLTFLKGNAELVRRLLEAEPPGPHHAQMIELLQDVEFGSRRIEELLAALRRFGGGSEVPEKEVPAAALMERTLRLVESRRPRNVALRVEPPAGDVLVRVRPVEMESCLMNLLVNAFEAVDPSRGRVSFLAHVDGEDGGELSLLIEDDGPGIPPEKMEELFTPFITQKRRGMGLGLSIAYDAASRNGAKLELDTHPGSGTKARVRLPWHRRAPEPEKAPASPDAA